MLNLIGFWVRTRCRIVGVGLSTLLVSHSEWLIEDVFEVVRFRDQPYVVMLEIVTRLLYGIYERQADLLNRGVSFL